MELQIEEQQEGILLSMSRAAVEYLHTELDYLQYLHELIELEHEAKMEVEVADTNTWVAEGELLDVTMHCDQVAELHQCFEQGSVKPEDFVDTVNFLR
jgi:hypothetical protein